jgi:hypothetical protein
MTMSFIESLFGISPDGGSGAFELLLMLAPVALAVWRLARRRPEKAC